MKHKDTQESVIKDAAQTAERYAENYISEILNKYSEKENRLNISDFNVKQKSVLRENKKVLQFSYSLKNESKEKAGFNCDFIIYVVPRKTALPAYDIDNKNGYYITIVRQYFGRPKYSVELMPGKIYTWEKLKSNEFIVEKITLNEDQHNFVIQYLNDFPFDKLDPSYINPGVKDGLQLSFNILLNGKTKNISVANYFQEDLCKLSSFIAGFLPEDLIGYNKE